jgi:hypothetical protein
MEKYSKELERIFGCLDDMELKAIDFFKDLDNFKLDIYVFKKISNILITS